MLSGPNTEQLPSSPLCFRVCWALIPFVRQTGRCVLSKPFVVSSAFCHKMPPPRRDFSNVRLPLISSDYLVEEETLPFYEHEQYYLVRIGELFNFKSQAVAKLRNGAYSTA